MPKAQLSRQTRHHSSVKKANIVGDEEDGNVADNNVPALTEAPAQLTKKEKKQEKRVAFLQKLDPSALTFSKSHERRMKRKARDQLAGETLDDLSMAIATMEKEALEEQATTQTIAEAQGIKNNQKTSGKKSGIIGEGRSAPLSRNQRKRAFELERLRHPLVLRNPEFSSNPFQTIRTHAQNTLLKHTPS